MKILQLRFLKIILYFFDTFWKNCNRPFQGYKSASRRDIFKWESNDSEKTSTIHSNSRNPSNVILGTEEEIFRHFHVCNFVVSVGLKTKWISIFKELSDKNPPGFYVLLPRCRPGCDISYNCAILKSNWP